MRGQTFLRAGPAGFERIVVDGPMPLSPALCGAVESRAAMVTIEGGDAIFRMDGGNVLESGHPLMAGDKIFLSGADAVKRFRALKMSGEPVLQVTYFY